MNRGRLRVRTQLLLTDSGGCYRSGALATLVKKHRLIHRVTRPCRPQTNGKAERFIRTLLRKWDYAHAYRASRWRTAALTYYKTGPQRHRHVHPSGTIGCATVNTVIVIYT